MIGEGSIYQPNEIESLTAQPIIDRLMKTIDDMNVQIYVDYLQNFIVDTEMESSNSFVCNYIPLENSIIFMVNGVCYTNSVNGIKYFDYDEENKTITWLFTKDNEGFDLETGFRVTLIYNFSMIANGLIDINDVK